MATQFIPKKKQIALWLDKYNVKNYTILPNNEVDVAGGVDLSFGTLGVRLAQIPSNKISSENNQKNKSTIKI